MAMRQSKKRSLILEILKSRQHEHLTADDVYRLSQKDFPNISLGTVYRNLHQLAEAGELLEIQFGKAPAMFEYPAERHPHFICNICGKIFNLEVPIENLIIRGVEKNEGHEVKSLDIVIYGDCRECKSGKQEDL